jgi:hypothetical protein
MSFEVKACVSIGTLTVTPECFNVQLRVKLCEGTLDGTRTDVENAILAAFGAANPSAPTMQKWFDTARYINLSTQLNMW